MLFSPLFCADTSPFMQMPANACLVDQPVISSLSRLTSTTRKGMCPRVS
ncbi:Uncharacterised protein [Mycobacterium tuberculosis]|nr:Uncharacterised protein [Mycobacterium tuberculosis]COX85510.1 Uncharacterised protein [Mycobacterium tuberculosis]